MIPLKARLHRTRIVVCEPLHQGVVGPLPLPDAAWINRPEPERITDDTNLKRRWGMGGTEPIENGVEAMPRRSAVESMLSGAIDTDSFDTNQMKGDIGQKNIDKKATTLLTTTDTTHYHAHSVFETVEYIDGNGKEKTKSQSKTTKKCGCEDPNTCPHPWELADQGAGTIVKAHNRYIWGHKASILGLPLEGIPLDAVAVSDAATHDGETIYPHVVRLFDNLPQVVPWIDTVLYDGAADSQGLKDKFDEDFGIRLRASLNPRRRKSVTVNLPRGMEKITPYGTLFCNAGYEMDYKGMRYESEKFIYHAPLDDSGSSVCLSCDRKSLCCPVSKKGRVATLPFSVLPHIDPKDPPMARRFKAMMTHRPSVERMIKRLKCDLSDDRLKKRGNAAFQAYLDKTMIAFHILLRQ
jgi:hypothetical protein